MCVCNAAAGRGGGGEQERELPTYQHNTFITLAYKATLSTLQERDR